MGEKTVERIACYIRVSTQEQKLHGLSLDAQREALIRYAEEHGLKIIEWYEDEGISGRKLIKRRPALQRMLNDAKANKFDRIIFIKLDRYFRSVAEYYECQKILEANNVTWTATEEKFDLTTANGRYWVTQKLAMAEYEADQTGERIKLVNEYKIKTGQPLTGAHCQGLAYTVVKDDETGLKKVVPDPETKEQIEDFINHFLINQSIRASVKYSNLKYGTNHSYRSFRSVLEDTKIYGHYKGNDFYCEPYIDKKTYDKIQDLLKNNVKERKNNSVYLFSGLIKCPCCGGKLTGTASVNRRNVKPNGKVYTYHNTIYQYRCNKQKIAGQCAFYKYPNELRLEKAMLSNLNRFINDHITHVKVTANTLGNNDNITNAINNIQSEMNRLNTMYRKGRIKEADYDKDYESLEIEMENLKESLIPEEDRDVSIYEDLLKADNWRLLYEALTRENKRSFWRKYVKEIRLDMDGKLEEIIFF